MKVWDPFGSWPSPALNQYKNNSSTANSPAESTYSLPCLSSDDTTSFGCGVEDTGLSTGANTFVPGISDSWPMGDAWVGNQEFLPRANAPFPSSPIIPPISQEHMRAIRPFPLLHLMLSPSFAAIRDMDDEPGMCIHTRLDKVILTTSAQRSRVLTSRDAMQLQLAI